MTTTLQGDSFDLPAGRSLGHFFANLPGGLYRLALRDEAFDEERRNFLRDLDAYIAATGFDTERCLQLYMEVSHIRKSAVMLAQRARLEEAQDLSVQSQELDQIAQEQLLPMYRAMRAKGYAHDLLVQ